MALLLKQVTLKRFALGPNDVDRELYKSGRLTDALS